MKRYSKEEKDKIIEQWKESGKSRWTFAKEQGIGAQTLYKWTNTAKGPTDFVELKTGSKTLPTNNRDIILERGETIIRIPLEMSEREMNAVTALWKRLV